MLAVTDSNASQRVYILCIFATNILILLADIDHSLNILQKIYSGTSKANMEPDTQMRAALLVVDMQEDFCPPVRSGHLTSLLILL